MSVPKTILDIAKVIKTEIDLSPKQDNRIVIPLDNFRDEAGVFIGKSTIEKVLRRLLEQQSLKTINLSDLHNHIMPLQSDKVEVEVDREKLNNLLLTEATEPSKQSVETKQEEISNTQPLKQKPPAGWNLQEGEGRSQLMKSGQVIFTFVYTHTDKYRYFKLAWQKYNQTAFYKELYETKPDTDYPDKRGENWKVNDHIRATMRKLRDEFEKKKVPITIETENGIKVFVQE